MSSASTSTSIPKRTKQRVRVALEGEGKNIGTGTYLIVIPTAQTKVEWLIHEIQKRYKEGQAPEKPSLFEGNETKKTILKDSKGALLHSDDLVKEVIDDDEKIRAFLPI